MMTLPISWLACWRTCCSTSMVPQYALLAPLAEATLGVIDLEATGAAAAAAAAAVAIWTDFSENAALPEGRLGIRKSLRKKKVLL